MSGMIVFPWNTVGVISSDNEVVIKPRIRYSRSTGWFCEAAYSPSLTSREWFQKASKFAERKNGALQATN